MRYRCARGSATCCYAKGVSGGRRYSLRCVIVLYPLCKDQCDANGTRVGAIGGPKWGVDAPIRPESGLLRLRKTLGLYANIRPTNFASDSLLAHSSLKESAAKGVDLIVVRELIGGIYFGERKEGGVGPDPEVAWDTMSYSVEEIKRITRVAGQIALTANPPLKVHSIDKANVLASSRLWRRVVSETIKEEFPQLELDHQLVDSTAMVLVASPRKLNGVILTENLFGDMYVVSLIQIYTVLIYAHSLLSLSDESSIIPGSLGLLPSASLAGAPSIPGSHNFKTTPGMYEPIHGSAPDIAGQGIANPVGTMLSVAMLLRYSCGLEKYAGAIEGAVRKVLDNEDVGGYGLRTRDLGGEVGTREIGDRVVEVLKGLL